MKTIRDFDLSKKTVLIRCDFNVPMKDGKILDDTRIRKALDTIEYAMDKNAKVVLLSHLGKVKEESDKQKQTLLPVQKRLEELLKKRVFFVNDCVGEQVLEQVKKLKDKEVLLLENTRFQDLDGKKESNNDPSLAQFWASLGDIFINDAFGTMHRAHASTIGIASFLPTGIGFLVEKEISVLKSLFSAPKPFILILGGSKIKDKIGIIKKFAPKCDKILIGGAMAATFLEAEGYQVGASLKETEWIPFCKEMLKEYPSKIILPVDFRCAKQISNQEGEEKDITDLEVDDIALDIGTQTIENFKNHLKDAKTVLWNGPLGAYEFSSYKKGTKEILLYLKDEKEKIKTVVGGGDTVACAMENHLENDLYHLSTGGGATLHYLEDETLVVLEAVEKNNGSNKSQFQ